MSERREWQRRVVQSMRRLAPGDVPGAESFANVMAQQTALGVWAVDRPNHPGFNVAKDGVSRACDYIAWTATAQGPFLPSPIS